MTINNEQLMGALYATKCEQIQAAWLNPETRRFIGDGYAYAAAQRMYPYFSHTTEQAANDPFEDCYDIKREFVKEVIEYMDKLQLEDSKHPKLAFYELEQKFGGHHTNRGELIAIIQYCRYEGRFDEDFYKQIVSNAPAEANSFEEELDPMWIAIS